MKWCARFAVLVVGVDGVVLAEFSSNPLWLILSFLSLVTLFILLVPRRDLKPALIEGWDLGPGINVDNPDQPNLLDKVVIPESVLCLGFLSIGGPGSGKSESVAIGYMHYLFTRFPENGYSFFCGKGQKDVYQKVVAAGVEFDYFFSTELPQSDSVNLMEGESQAVIDRLSRLLIGQTSSTSFYADEQRAVLSTVIPVLKALGMPVNLRDLYTLLTVDHAAIHVMRKIQGLEGVEPYIIESAKTFFAEEKDKRMGLMRGLLNRLSEFVFGVNALRLNAYQPSISIHDCVREGKRIYWHCPLSESSIAIATAITEICQGVAMQRQNRGGDHGLYPLMFDDWGAFFYDGFGPMAARCRSVNMPLSFLFQSVGQLKKVDHTFLDELDDSVATKVFLRIMGDETAQYAVRKFGRFETLEMSHSDSSRGYEGSGTNTQLVDRIDAEDLKDLNLGEAYINTLERSGGDSTNRFFKARFPLVPTPLWQTIDWPNKNQVQQGSGLNLWDQYMNPEQTHNRIESAVKNEIADLLAAEDKELI